MKIYISADIEGVAGIAHWNECDKSKEDYKKFAEQMTLEVKAACEGAIQAGANEIWVKDAHASARNIDHSMLPKNTKLIRGWSRHPYGMMQEIDSSFDASLLIGYHSYASSAGNLLAHTMSGQFQSIKINGMLLSEFLISTYTSNLERVPVVFLSGDESICKVGREFSNNITTVATFKGIGESAIGEHPTVIIEKIQENVILALKNDITKCNVIMPNSFKVEIEYKKPSTAYRNSFYPGMKQVSDTKIVFETNAYFEVLRMFVFTLNS
ncbi:MAG: M55 family metallopeptidase [Clostridiales bacterium]|nr:M55 family metallopeptidase [Clostridiales bacterium]